MIKEYNVIREGKKKLHQHECIKYFGIYSIISSVKGYLEYVVYIYIYEILLLTHERFLSRIISFFLEFYSRLETRFFFH